MKLAGRALRSGSQRPPFVGPEPPALLFGADVTGLAVLRSLGRNGIPVFTASSETRNIALSRWYRPAPGEGLGETSEPDHVAAYLLGLPFSRAVLIPASDDWALALASLPEDLTDSYPATVAPAAVLRTLIDKEHFAAAVRELDVPAPRTDRVDSIEDLDAISEAELSGFFLKPRNSQEFSRRLGRKALPLADRSDAVELVGRATREGLEVVLQELIPGPPTAHVFVDGYVDRRGAMRACLARRRLRMHPREFGNSTLSVTIPLSEVGAAVDSLRRLFDGIGYIGLFDAEFKHDHRDGRFKVLEVNARPWWQLELATASGLDLCLLAYRDAIGLPLSPAPGYRLGRTWVHPVPDLKAWWAERRSGDSLGGSPFRAWFGGANAVFSWDDPLPATEELARRGRRALLAGWPMSRARR